MFNQPYLTEENKMVSELYRNFVEKEIMPVRQQIDDDKDHKIVRKILQALTDVGHQKAAFPTEYGGNGMTAALPAAIMHEELGRGDSGVGTAATVTTWAFMPAIMAGNKAVLDRFAPEFCGPELRMGCFAMTEPASGCDVENLHEMHGKTIATHAVRDGDEWVINGSKRFPSSAGVSSLYCVVCQTDVSKGEDGIALIYVPADAKGLSFGKFEVKAGMQSDRNCDIFFDDVRVPITYRASGIDSRPGTDKTLLARNLTVGRIASAAAAVGCARGAWDEVLRYTGERVVGGKPIREHSIAAGILADIITGIETARAHYLQVAYMASNPEQFGELDSEFMLSQASITKNYACDMANASIGRAMELMASYGYIRDYHVEKYWRDVKEVQLWLGGKQLAQFDTVRGFYPYRMD